MKIKSGMYVVVADGARGVVLVNEGTALAPDLAAVRVYEQDNPKTSEQGRDRPTRTFESMGARRSAKASADLHQRAEDRFVQQIMADLAKDRAAGAFEDAVIVAPPVALGEMRKAADAVLSKAIVAWIDKDLTKHSIPEITSSVEKALDV